MTPKNSFTAAANAFRAIAQSRISVKRFQPNRPIPESVISDIISTTLTSPSGFNLQPTQVIILRNPKIKSILSQHAMLGPGNAYKTSDASLIAVFLSDLEIHKRIPRILELEKKSNFRPKGYLVTFPLFASFALGEGKAATLFKRVASDALSPLRPTPTIENVEAWSYKNTSLMAQTFVLAATSHGLSTCIMEGYDARRLKDILRIPDRYGVPMIVATGYEYEEGKEEGKSPRLDVDEVFFGDVFGGQLHLDNEDDKDKAE